MQATTVDRRAGTPLHAGDPRRLGPYELLSRLGTGGQGAVFLGVAKDGHRDGGSSGKRVAIKLLHADLTENPAARARFVREAAAAKKVARFCAAQVLDADVEGDRPYIVSEYVEGPSVGQLVKDRGPVGGGALERLAIGTATALVAIHQAGIVHRDLKPANVLVAQDGPRVIDFGIAKALDGTATVSSRVVGTPAYMAPEQLQGISIGPAVDVFAWGALMTFVATGLPPFGTDSIPLVVNRILNADPQLGGLSGRMRELVRDCLVKDPARRPTARQILLRLLGQEAAVVPLTGLDMVGTEVLQEAATLAATRVPFPAPMMGSSSDGEAWPVAVEAPYDPTSFMTGAPFAVTSSTKYDAATQPAANEYGLQPVAEFPQAAFPQTGYAPQRRRGRGRVALACAGGAAAVAVAGVLLLASQSPTVQVKDSGSKSTTNVSQTSSDSGSAGGGTDSAPRQPSQNTSPTGSRTNGWTNGGTGGGTNGSTGGGTNGSTGGGTNGGTSGGTNGGTGTGTGTGTNGGTGTGTGTGGGGGGGTNGGTGGPTDVITVGPPGKTDDGSTQPSNCGYAGCT